MVAKLAFSLSVLGFANAYMEDYPCGSCVTEGHIYCYQGKTPQTQFNRIFNQETEYNHKCCKDDRSCPEYLAGQADPTKAEWICLKQKADNGLINQSSVPLAECPYVTSLCGKEKDLTYAASLEIEAKGVGKGQVCAWELDPTIRKPVINLNGDDRAKLQIQEVDIEVRDESLLTDSASSVNFLKGANTEDAWDQFYDEENAAYNSLDTNLQGVSVDLDTNKRFRPFVDLRNVPINECLNSKIKSGHQFNYDTEQSRLPTNNPEYNAALYEWHKYTN